jgi:hypothetical protein
VLLFRVLGGGAVCVSCLFLIGDEVLTGFRPKASPNEESGFKGGFSIKLSKAKLNVYVLSG